MVVLVVFVVFGFILCIFKYYIAISSNERLTMFPINWIVANELAGSRYPDTTDLDDVYSHGIRAIVSLERYAEPQAITEHRMEHLDMSIPDFTAPSLAQLRRIMSFIEAMTEKFKPVLVHCYAGIGRTGTVAAAYLIKQGNSVDSALRQVRARIPGAVQTPDQEQILHVFEQDCNNISFKF